MLSCTFFGHRDTDEEVILDLRNIITDLIENKNVRKFYVGNHGKFDYMVKCILSEFEEKYKISYSVVLAYIPQKADFLNSETKNTLIPEGLESVPKKFAIDWVNRWMLKQSEYVVVYVKYITGGAAKFKEIAEKQNKIVLNLAHQ